MTGIPYDDLVNWCGQYPVPVFIGQFTKMADGFDSALKELRSAAREHPPESKASLELAGELSVMETCAIDFRSVANQARFVVARRQLEDKQATREEARQACATLKEVLESEIGLARRLYAIQRRDSRIGFEATNHYFFIPQDLVEKVINCHDLLERWLPAERARLGL